MSTSGIPRAHFDADPARLLLPHHRSPQDGILYYRELVQKYRFLEANLEERLARTEAKRDELEKNLAVVKLLKRARREGLREVTIEFELGEGVMVRGRVEEVDKVKVHLWLSSSVMVAYEVEEAERLLEVRLEETEKSILQTDSEQVFLKEQITTSEVNMARLYNYHLANQKK